MNISNPLAGDQSDRVGRVFTRPTAVAIPVGLVKTRPTLLGKEIHVGPADCRFWFI